MTTSNGGDNAPILNISAPTDDIWAYIMGLVEVYPPGDFVLYGWFIDWQGQRILVKGWVWLTGGYRYASDCDLIEMEVKHCGVNDDLGLLPYGKAFWISEKEVLS